MLGQSFEVLDGSGEDELIAGAGEAPQSEPDHRENVLSLTKETWPHITGGAKLASHSQLILINEAGLPS